MDKKKNKMTNREWKELIKILVNIRNKKVNRDGVPGPKGAGADRQRRYHIIMAMYTRNRKIMDDNGDGISGPKGAGGDTKQCIQGIGR